MLKNIPKIVSPQLLKVLCEMGHGDEIVLADGNFPAESMGKGAIVVRADGHGVAELLDAVLALVPLDQYAEQPAALMEAVPGDPCVPVIWDEYCWTRMGKIHRGFRCWNALPFMSAPKKPMPSLPRAKPPSMQISC